MTRVNPASPVTDGRTRRYQHRRGEILDAVADHVVAHGRHDLSLRAAAAAAGVSHATLLHHFGTKDVLIEEVLQRIGDRAPDPLAQPDNLTEGLRTLWSYWSAEDGTPALALQYENFAAALRDRERHHDYLVQTARQWIDAAIASAIASGCPDHEAAPFATTLVAALRGLVLDLAATQDHDRVNAAFELLLRRVAEDAASWRRADGTA